MRTSRAGFTALSKCGAQQVVLFVLTELSSHTELQLTESLIHTSYQRHTYQRQCFRQRHFWSFKRYVWAKPWDCIESILKEKALGLIQTETLQTENRKLPLICTGIQYEKDKKLKLQWQVTYIMETSFSHLLSQNVTQPLFWLFFSSVWPQPKNYYMYLRVYPSGIHRNHWAHSYAIKIQCVLLLTHQWRQPPICSTLEAQKCGYADF